MQVEWCSVTLFFPREAPDTIMQGCTCTCGVFLPILGFWASWRRTMYLLCALKNCASTSWYLLYIEIVLMKVLAAVQCNCMIIRKTLDSIECACIYMYAYSVFDDHYHTIMRLLTTITYQLTPLTWIVPCMSRDPRSSRHSTQRFPTIETGFDSYKLQLPPIDDKIVEWQQLTNFL